MVKIRKDYTVKKNMQSERKELQPDLWDVVLGNHYCIITITGKQAAHDVAEKLNKDPWYLDWSTDHRNFSQ